MNSVWRKLCLQFVNDFHEFEKRVGHVIRNVIALSKEIDLYMEIDDVTELLESHEEKVSAGELIQLEKPSLEVLNRGGRRNPHHRALGFHKAGLVKRFC